MTDFDMECFNANNFTSLCDKLGEKDSDLHSIIKQYGYPPFWSRIPSFATLIHIILEQQVSLASAKAALLKLESTIGDIVPEKILLMGDEELKACYFSRQKIKYARHLAETVLDKKLVIENLKDLPDEKIRTALKKVKGIGDWTVDVFLMMCLHRCDCFPAGDIALIKSVREVKSLHASTSKEIIIALAEKWKPYRTVAAYLLWHAYLQKRNPALKRRTGFRE